MSSAGQPVSQDTISALGGTSEELEAVSGWQPNTMTRSSLRSALSGNGAVRLVRSMGDLGLITAEQSSTGAAALEMISGGVQVLEALRAIMALRESEKIAEGIASLSKYTVYAPVVAAAAVGGAIAYEEVMDRDLDLYGDYSTTAGIRNMKAQLAREGLA